MRILSAAAARDYFHYLHPGLNRRNDDPVNSCLNYGYAVLRNAIIRAAMLAGIEEMIGSIRNRIVTGEGSLKLPIVLPKETIEAIKE